jgi:hypothetical protein
MIVPAVRRTEQGFRNAKTAILLEFADVIRSKQMIVLKCVE